MNVLPGDIAMVILSEETGKVDPVQYALLRERLGLTFLCISSTSTGYPAGAA